MLKFIFLAYGILCTLSGFLLGWYARRDRKPPVERSPGTRKQPYSAEREAERIIMEAMR